LDSVVESAVVGLPDEQRGEIVTAVIVLADGYEPSPELEDEIRESVKRRLSKHQYPRRIEFVSELPKTATGKIQRFQVEEEFTS